MKIIVFYVTTGSEEEANTLGRMAVENKLAACANILPARSIYLWEGQLQQDHEFVLILKTFPELIIELISLLEKHHSYKVPCIMHWETEVNDAYGNWMENIITTI